MQAKPRPSLGSIPFLDSLHNSTSVLLAGCGGGCDVYASLPIYYDLINRGIKCTFFNLSFAALDGIQGTKAIPLPDSRASMYAVDFYSYLSYGKDYFPERALAEYLKQYPALENADNGEDIPVYTLHRTFCGPVNVSKAYAWLVEQFAIDAIVTIDAGSDSLMAGNEEGLGSYEEDLGSVLATAAQTSVPFRILAVVGLGVDTYHGVSDVSSLRAIAELRKAGGYLGAITLLPTMPAFEYYKECVDYAMRRVTILPSSYPLLLFSPPPCSPPPLPSSFPSSLLTLI
jgi:hypothetical protein